ncbi:MAG: Rab family GTPase [Candidatus Helarchaeota archaeon]
MSEKFGFKVIITGDTAVGKTSLVRRYCDNKFDANQKPSIGADFTIKVVHFAKYEVILTIWDIGGQVLFDNLRDFYYQGSDAGIIVFDVTNQDSLKRISAKWLPEMQSINNISIIILANKIDLKQDRIIGPEECQQLSNDLGIPVFETSAKTGINVKKAFEALAKSLVER